MADQCIVCLEDLDVPLRLGDAGADDPSLAVQRHPEGTATNHSNNDAEPSINTTQLQIAVIKACGHVLHDDCLKEWTEKANSCPICRSQFNLVEVHETTKGPTISTYTVEDKKQVAEFDQLAWLEDQEAGVDQSYLELPCQVCGSYDHDDVLLLCDNCNSGAHTYCVGLDSVPDGDWYCEHCAHEEADRRNAGEELLEGPPPRERREQRHRTLAQLRDARQESRTREHVWAGAWYQISNQVHALTGLDLDFDGADELGQYRDAQMAQRHAEQLRNQRIRIARQQGAGNAFANMSRPLARTPIVPREPAPETDAERRAWAHLEKVRQKEKERAEEEEAAPNGPPRRRKRKATESPLLVPVDSNASTEPERKLKRPRKRQHREPVNSASSSANVAATAANGSVTSQVSGTPHRSPRQVPTNRSNTESSVKPSFLSSLLTEVEQSSRGGSDSDLGHASRFDSNNEHNFSANSPGSSSSSTPRALSLTPPLNRRGASAQMSLSSIIEPVYPPSEYSPNRVTAPRPSGNNGLPSSRPTSPSPGIRHPQPHSHRAHTALSSPASPSALAHLSHEELMQRKTQIKGMVKKHLDPHFRHDGTGITKEQYTMINQRVSRICYENLPPLEGMDDSEKCTWERRIKREVEKGVMKCLNEASGEKKEDKVERAGVAA